jgi:hypothetical protein
LRPSANFGSLSSHSLALSCPFSIMPQQKNYDVYCLLCLPKGTDEL